MIGVLVQDDFEVQGLILGTASGTIYRGRQLSLNRAVSLMFPNVDSGDAKACARFTERARLWATVHHPDLVQVFALGTHAGAPFVVTEPVAGQPLASLIRDTSVVMRRRLEIMVGAARGLEAIHAAGIVHRNLSPSSIFVDGATSKILDLGSPRSIGVMTQESQELGAVATADYLSPEQIEGGEVTSQADVYAFGAILYELVSGVRPFRAEHPMTMAMKILNEAPEPLPDPSGELPVRLTGLVMRCLEKNPTRRPGSMSEVERELVAIAASAADSSPSLPASAQAAAGDAVHNPYGNAVMIRKREDFFGREQEVRWLYSRLNADPPGSASIIGDRKIGKSSLLNYIYMRANRNARLREPMKMVMVFMNLQGQDATIESFCTTLLRLVALELGDRLQFDESRPNLDGLRVAVEQVHAAGFQLVILLDEFECITGNPNFPLSFFSFLRYLATVHNVAYVTASVRDLQTLCHNEEIRDSPFFNIFSARRLGAFLPEEALELIRVPSQGVGRPLLPHANEIIGLSGLFPFYIQLACAHALSGLTSDRRLDFGEIKRSFSVEVEPHFRNLWEELDDVERDVLHQVAIGKKIAESSHHVLESLVSRQYVQRHDPKPGLFADTFRDFVVRTSRTESLRHAPRDHHHTRVAAVAPPSRRLPAPAAYGLYALAAIVVGLAAFLAWQRLRSEHGAGRGAVATLRESVAPMLPHYQNSYALVIGEVNYPHWGKLPGVDDDVREVSALLRDHGFVVDVAENRDSDGLGRAFKDFIDRRGRHQDDRLLVYFAGHGYTMPQLYGGQMGYIVPVDAPDPKQDPEGFRAKAMSMIQVRTYALEIQAKHVLFVFDACFAGTIFTPMREGPPASIQFNCTKPVRQFITSGTADEKVPDESHFRKWFVTGLRGGADLNGDGYVTAYELAGYLRTNVSNELGGQQNPQYGVLAEVGQGDVVFSMADLDRRARRP